MALVGILAQAATGDVGGVSQPTGNQTGLPGGAVAAGFLNGVVYYGTILTIAGLILSAGLWAVGSFSNNYTQSVNGKKGFMICAAAALVIGGAWVLTQWFFGQGSQIA